MKIATVPSKKRKQLITVILLLLGLPLVVFASLQVAQLVTRASVEAEPKNVLISNLGTSSATISWVTDVSSSSSVVPIVNNMERSPVLDKRGGGRRSTHYVELDNLEPNTEYEFAIISDSQKYSSEGGSSFKFRTAPVTADSPTANPIHGSVNGASGDDVVVFAILKDLSVYPVSTTIPRGGAWIIDLSALRLTSDRSLVSVSDNTRITIVAVGGPDSGSVIEGQYSELFDSNGKLKDVYALNISSDPNIYSYFSGDSILQVDSESREDISIPTPPIDSDDTDFEGDFGSRSGSRFRIVSQVPWENMVGGESTTLLGQRGINNVEVVNVTDTDFSVVWITQNKEDGYIKYGTSKDALTNEATDDRDGLTSKGEYFVHIVSISRLQPNLEYFFEIISGGEMYDNEGNKYSVRTFPTLSSPPPFDSIAGTVEDLPSHGEAVVTVYIEDKDNLGSSGKSNMISSVVDFNGRWILSISDSRTEDGLSFYEYTSGDILNIDILTTSSRATHTENMEGVTNRDIDISLQDTTVLGTQDGGVELLGNYGILGYTSETRTDVSIDPLDPSYEVDYGVGTKKTPKTGLFDSRFFVVAIVVLVLVAVMPIVYILGIKKKKKNNNMKGTL